MIYEYGSLSNLDINFVTLDIIYIDKSIKPTFYYRRENIHDIPKERLHHDKTRVYDEINCYVEQVNHIFNVVIDDDHEDNFGVRSDDAENIILRDLMCYIST